jgi:Right handed beta helix region
MTIDRLEIYVSPEGKDSNPGTSNNPFLSLDRVLKELKNIHDNQKDFTGNIDIILADGTYFNNKPLEITPEFLPIKGGKVTFKAAKDAHPVISGGYLIKDWKQQADGTYIADIPKNIINDIPPRGLFINGERKTRARYPNDDYLTATNITPDGRRGIYFDRQEIPDKITGEFEVVHLNDWTINRAITDKIDYSKSLISFNENVGARADYFKLNGHTNNPPFFLENNPRFLDAPEEWFFDEKNNQITYYPEKGESIANLNAFIPISQGILSLKGTPKNQVKNVHFENLTFSHTNWELPLPSFAGVQGIYYDDFKQKNSNYQMEPIPAAVSTTFANNCSFQNLEFSHLNTSGLYLGMGTNNCLIKQNHFYDVSGTGIFVGEGGDTRNVGDRAWEFAEPEVAAFNNKIESNLLENIGVEYFGSVGIGIGLSNYNTVRNNVIKNLPYTGISVGFKWSTDETPAHHNLIENNSIEDVMLVMNDGAGIYTLGHQPGTVIRNNLIEDLPEKHGRGPNAGIYTDQGSDAMEITNNTLINIKDVPIFNNSTGTNWLDGNEVY